MVRGVRTASGLPRVDTDYGATQSPQGSLLPMDSSLEYGTRAERVARFSRVLCARSAVSSPPKTVVLMPPDRPLPGTCVRACTVAPPWRCRDRTCRGELRRPCPRLASVGDDASRPHNDGHRRLRPVRVIASTRALAADINEWLHQVFGDFGGDRSRPARASSTASASGCSTTCLPPIRSSRKGARGGPGRVQRPPVCWLAMRALGHAVEADGGFCWSVPGVADADRAVRAVADRARRGIRRRCAGRDRARVRPVVVVPCVHSCSTRVVPGRTEDLADAAADMVAHESPRYPIVRPAGGRAWPAFRDAIFWRPRTGHAQRAQPPNARGQHAVLGPRGRTRCGLALANGSGRLS